MEEIQAEVYYRGNGYPSYTQMESFQVVEGDLKEAALEILYGELEGFTDSEICDGITVSANVTDGKKFKIFEIVTDGLFSEKQEIRDLNWVEGRMCEPFNRAVSSEN